MKRKQLFLLVLLCLFGLSGAYAQSRVILNPTGGTSSTDGILAVITPTGTFNIYYQGYRQNFGHTDLTNPPSINYGSAPVVRFKFSDAVNADVSAGLTGIASCSITALEGAGTTADPQRTVLTGTVTSPRTLQRYNLTCTFTWEGGNYMYMDYILRSPFTLTQSEKVHLYIDEDTYMGDDDWAMPINRTTTTGHIVGAVRTGNDCSGNARPTLLPTVSYAYKVSGTFGSFYSDQYNNRTDAIAGNTTVFLSNSLNTTCKDDGIAIHVPFPTFTGPGQVQTRRIMLGLGVNATDFDNVVINNPPVPPPTSSPVSVQFASATFSETEGDATHDATSIQVKVQGGILGSPQTVGINVTAGTAAENVDYTYQNAFIIPAGNYTTEQLVTVNSIHILGNTVIQGNRTMSLTLAGDDCNDLVQLGTQKTATATIVDDDKPTVSIQKKSDITTCSTSTNVFDVVLSKAISTPTTVTVTLSGTASSTDFSAMSPTNWYTTGTVTVLPNTTAVSLYLTATGNNVIEAGKTVTATLASAISGSYTLPIAVSPANTATATVIDCDDIPANKVITLIASPTAINRGTGTGTTSVISARLPAGITSASLISITLSGSGATSYSFSSPTLDIPALSNTSTANVTLSASCGVFTNQTLGISGLAAGYTFTPVPLNVAINAVSVSPTITGNASVCAGSRQTYTTETGMSSYVWTAPGGTVFSGAGTNTLTVDWGTGASGTVTVTYTNASGCGPASPTSKSITLNPRPVPTITGSISPCAASRQTYTTESGMTGYAWTVAGGTIVSGASTNTFVVDWGTSTSGTVTVTYTNGNSCTPVTPTSQAISIGARPVPTISGSTTPCAASRQTYTTESGMTGYAWTVTGGTVVSGASTNTFVVDWGTGTSGTVTVTYSNGCTPATPTSQSITINTRPVPTIGGSGSVCAGSQQTYTTETGMGSYVWTVTGGTVVSGANSSSFVVDWGTGASGTVTVTYTNGCTPASPTSKNITINARPVPTISGSTAPCAASRQTYTTETGMTSYAWTVIGGTIVSGTNTSSFVVDWGTGTSGTVTVTYTNSNSCTPVTPTSQAISIGARPVPTISGSTTPCAASRQTYTTETGMSSYAWTVTGGTVVSGASTNTFVVDWGTGTSGTVTVTYSNGCTPATPTSQSITINARPVPTITGSGSICAGSQQTYATETGMTGYTWTVTGGTIVSGANSSSFVVDWGTGASGIVTVTYTNASGCTPASPTSKNITINARPVPMITGSGSVCAGSQQTYTTESGMTGYAWTVTGGTIVSGTNTNTFVVDWGTGTSGTVTVTYTNGNSCTPASPTSKNITINARPVPTISGSTAPCAASRQTYTTETGMTSYVWTVTGGTIVSGTNTSNFVVDWGTGTSGTVTVTYTNGNSCTPVTPTSQVISIGARPVPTISGSTTPCAASRQTYTTESGMTGYTWTVIGGTIVSGSTTNSFVVDWGTGASGSVTVTYSNGCMPATPTSQAITINPRPVPTISGNTSICAGSRQIYTTEAGMTGYAWTVIGGTVVSGATTNTFTVDWGTAGSGSVTVTYTNGNSCTPATPTSQAITINALPTVSINNVSANEGSSLTFTVTLTGGHCFAGSATVQYTTVNGEAVTSDDYTATSGTLTFLYGETSKTITVATATDNLLEGAETLTVQLSNPSSCALSGGGSTLSGTGTINDRTNGEVIVEKYLPLPAATALASEPSTNGSFRIRFANPSVMSTTATKVGIAVLGTSTAISGVDYEPITATYVTIQALQNGVELPITVKNNNIVQGQRSLKLNITGIIP